MSGIKRSLSTDDIDDDNESTKISENCSEAKKLRHASSHSENEDDTQLLDSENGIADDLSTNQSGTDDEETTDNLPSSNTYLEYSIPRVEFDNGSNDRYRYDGEIKFHICVPSRQQFGQVVSEPTIIRTFPWTLVAYFKKNFEPYRHDNDRDFSLFLKSEIILLHPTDPNKNCVRKVAHLFNSRTEDWGYRSFRTMKEIYSEFIHPSDHTIRIEAKIHADPPRNVNWDSKDQTGFIGLRNIGATCYMNSFLQTIYFTKRLRKAVYALPTDNDIQLQSIPLALQKVFYDLQFTDKPINTRKLTRSFGWDKPDEFCQHDIQEFCRVLLDKLECNMEGTTMEGIIPSLYQGQYVQYVQCTGVKYESRVTQTFYDVPLQVRNNRNITESFRDFCKKEILTGDNLYDAGAEHGLQEAEKGVRFLRFPPVLCLHLLRFEYDYHLSQNRKINDIYSFDYHLDLNEFLENPDCSSCSYKLLSILVHSGDNSSGHYVSFINPELDGQWFKFDDDIVARVAPRDAMERNFGGPQDEDGTMYNTSAYMLVYIREDCQNDVLCDITLEDIPENLIKRFNYEKTMLAKRLSNEREKDVVDVPIILSDNFDVSPTACLADIIHESTIKCSRDNSVARYVQAHRLESFGDFAERLARQMGVNLHEDIRIWLVNFEAYTLNHHYHTQPVVTCKLVHFNDYEKKTDDIFRFDLPERVCFPVFIERKLYLDGTYRLLPFNEDDILIFVRFYNSRDESLLYIGHYLFSPQEILHKCLNDIALRMKYPVSSSSTFVVHQSVQKHSQLHKYETVDSSNFDLPIAQALHPCSSGVSLIIQIFDANQTENANSPTTVDDYFHNQGTRQQFDVCNRDSHRSETLFKLLLPPTTSVKEVIRLIAERISYPEEQIIIQKTSNTNSNANTVSSASSFHIGSEQILRELYPSVRANASSLRKIYFKRLPFHYTELEHRRLFRIHLTNPMKRDQQREVQFYPKTNATVLEFVNEIRQWLPTLYPDHINQKLRIVELILNEQINFPFELRICSEQSRIDEYPNCAARSYHLEEILPDDSEQNKDSVLIPVAHYIKENSIQINLQNFFPFFLRVVHNETFTDVKRRLQTRLALTNREFEKYRFSIFNGNKSLPRCDDNMGRINLRELKPFQKTCWLGLELPLILNPRKPRKSSISEKAIRIN